MSRLANEPRFLEELNKLAIKGFAELERNEAIKKSASKFFQDVFSDPRLQKKAGDGMRAAVFSGFLGWKPSGF